MGKSARGRNREAGVEERGFDEFLKNPQQDAIPSSGFGQLLLSCLQFGFSLDKFQSLRSFGIFCVILVVLSLVIQRDLSPWDFQLKFNSSVAKPANNITSTSPLRSLRPWSFLKVKTSNGSSPTKATSSSHARMCRLTRSSFKKNETMHLSRDRISLEYLIQ